MQSHDLVELSDQFSSLLIGFIEPVSMAIKQTLEVVIQCLAVIFELPRKPCLQRDALSELMNEVMERLPCTDEFPGAIIVDGGFGNARVG